MGDRRGGGATGSAAVLGDQPAGADRRGRADAARQAPGAAAAPRAYAAHPARGRTRPAARRGPGRRGGAAARARPAGRDGQFGACVLLKGSTTVVAPPDGTRPGAGQHHRDVVARHRRHRRRAGRARGRAARAGAAAPQAAHRGRLPARPRRRGSPRRTAPGQPPVPPGRRCYGGGEAPIGASDVVAALPVAFRALGHSIDGSWTAMRRPSVELGAITRNIAALRAHVAPSAVMAVVKANGYGHGVGAGRPRGDRWRRAMAWRRARGRGARAARGGHRQSRCCA